MNEVLISYLSPHLYPVLQKIVADYADESALCAKIAAIKEVSLLCPEFAEKKDLSALEGKLLAVLNLLPKGKKEWAALEAKLAGKDRFSYERMAALVDVTAMQFLLGVPSSPNSPSVNKKAKILSTVAFVLTAALAACLIFVNLAFIFPLPAALLLLMFSALVYSQSKKEAALGRLLEKPLGILQKQLILPVAPKAGVELVGAYAAVQEQLSQVEGLKEKSKELLLQVADKMEQNDPAQALEILNSQAIAEALASLDPKKGEALKTFLGKMRSALVFNNEVPLLEMGLRESVAKVKTHLEKGQNGAVVQVLCGEQFKKLSAAVPPGLGVELELLVEKVLKTVGSSEALELMGYPLERLLQSSSLYGNGAYDQTSRGALREMKRHLLQIRAKLENRESADDLLNGQELADTLLMLSTEQRALFAEVLKKVKSDVEENGDSLEGPREAIRLLEKPLTRILNRGVTRRTANNGWARDLRKRVRAVDESLKADGAKKWLDSESLDAPLLRQKHLFDEEQVGLAICRDALNDLRRRVRTLFEQGHYTNGMTLLNDELEQRLQAVQNALEAQVRSLRLRFSELFDRLS